MTVPHLAHPGPDGNRDKTVPSFWPPDTTLCGRYLLDARNMRAGMGYIEVPVAGDNPNVETCRDCNFALFVEQQEARHLAVGSLIERVA